MDFTLEWLLSGNLFTQGQGFTPIQGLNPNGVLNTHVGKNEITLSLQYNVHGFERSLVEVSVKKRFNIFS